MVTTGFKSVIMVIKLKLFAGLRRYLDVGLDGGREFELAPGASVLDLLNQVPLPLEEVHLTLVNGIHHPVDGLGALQLNEGDVVGVWPPIAGG